MELVNIKNKIEESTFKDYPSINRPGELNNVVEVIETNSFLEANTTEIGMQNLSENCVIPVFAKDNERTIAHQEFIDITRECAELHFSSHSVSEPEIRVSHQIKGRTPGAIHKSAKDLLDSEKTQYFERMAFIIKIPGITETVNGNKLSLTIGGVRSYNSENLYSKKNLERFKIFIGFQNMVCCNLCISTDGFLHEYRAGNYQGLKEGIMEMLRNYQIQYHLNSMKALGNEYLTENQFAQLIGRTKLYSHMPSELKADIPPLLLNDGQVSLVAKDYYFDKSFSRIEDGRISLWNMFNLFTGANKSSYIDKFIDRNVNAYSFTQGISKSLNSDSKYHWYLS